MKIFCNRNVLKEIISFAAIGTFVTVTGVILMFLFYNFFNMGYWGSSAVSYFICSILSLVLNKRITFKSATSFSKIVPKFFINIGACYFLAYFVAQPTMRFFLNNLQIHERNIIDQAALLLGAIFFTCLNFIGQKFFVFKKGENFNL